MTRSFELLLVCTLTGAGAFANDVQTDPVPDSMIGEWRYDHVKTMNGRAAQYPEGAKAAHSLKGGCLVFNPRISVTITETRLTVTSDTAGTHTRSYTIIGGNAALAIIQYIDHNGSERVANIQRVPGGISILDVSPGRYELERLRVLAARIRERSIDSFVDSRAPTPSGLTGDWQNHLRSSEPLTLYFSAANG